jgi:hypothetical protein
VEVLRQQVQGLRRNSGWSWFWMARRAGHRDWHEAGTAPAAHNTMRGARDGRRDV